MRILLLWFLCGLPAGCRDGSGLSADAQGPSVRKEFNKGPLQVRLELSTDQILLSEIVRMDITTIAESGFEVEFPKIADLLRDFRLRDRRERGRKLLAEGRVQIAEQYRLEPLRTGELEIPTLSFQCYKDSESDRLTLETEPIVITVTTMVQEDLSEVSIADIEEIVEMKRGLSWFWITGLGIFAGGMLAVVIFLLRPKKAHPAKKIYRPAHEIALEWIRKLAEQRLIEQGRVREFYERLSNCLRHYIENRFSLRAPEQTTEEFLEAIEHSPILQAEHKEELKRFLEHCDLVKFAKYQPTREQNDQSLRMAEQFIVNTKSDESLVEAGPDGEAR